MYDLRVMRSARLPVALSLATLLLLAPAGWACGELARMRPDCPMFAVSGPSGTEASQASVPARPGQSGCHDRVATAGTAAATPKTRLHEPGPAAAECCFAEAAPGAPEALFFGAPKLATSLAALASGGAPASLPPSPEGFASARIHGPPPLDELPRYARFSSYLL